MADGNAADPRFVMAPDGREPMRKYMRSWFGPQPFPTTWIAEVDGRAVGFVYGFPMAGMAVVVRGPTLRIGDMYVAPGHRRKGIGRALVDRLVRGAADAGYDRVEVGTLTQDARAVAFWKGLGFTDWQVTLLKE